MLQAGDILFKHASEGGVSPVIRAGQGPHYDAVIKEQGPSDRRVNREEAKDLTHVAMAVGQDDVLEFDEGGAGTLNIAFGKGHGFVRGPMSYPTRLGKRYEVYRCTTDYLAKSAADKAELIWDLTHQGEAVDAFEGRKPGTTPNPVTGSYGLSKMVRTALNKSVLPKLLQSKGTDMSDPKKFEAQLNAWLTAAEPKSALAGLFQDRVQFFCSEFVTFCYLWAASEYNVDLLGFKYVVTTRIAPAELYTRVKTDGQAHFRFRGSITPINMPSGKPTPRALRDYPPLR
jgi:hypothetical protein